MSVTKQSFWNDYYEQLQAEGNPWLDCSNDRTHLQTISLALEAAGQVIGRRCLEIGCGRGHLSRCLSVLGAGELVAVDQVESMIAEQSAHFPEVAWHCRDASDHVSMQSLGKFDLIFVLEVLQYLPLVESLQCFAKQLLPGGRLVGVVPNAECPIVQKAMDHFEGNYVAADIEKIEAALEAIPEIDHWTCRGLTFASDQRIVPYEASPWTTTPDWPQPPNRLLFVAQASAA
ncbi:MAG: methyltransferase domain-containing protein [Pirellulales bacterium]|nr:methyltransferase domain-containing protein [Pirellulales bacterium]